MTDYVGKRGLVLSYDPHRSLGDLQLEDGERLRFGGTGVGHLGLEAGLRVEIVEMGQTYSGEPKAVRLARLDADALVERWVWPAEAARGQERPFDRDAFAAHHPTWASTEKVRELVRPLLQASSGLRATLKPHPFFDPWRDGIAQTAALSLGLTYRAGQVAEGESRLGGTNAELSIPWPRCSRCDADFELVFQLFLDEFPVLFDEGGSLSFFLCPSCRPTDHSQMERDGSGLLRYEARGNNIEAVSPKHERATSSSASKAIRIEAVPRASFPSVPAFERTVRSPTASLLFSVGLSSGQSGAEAYQHWVEHGEPGSHLGGFLRWRKLDRTPDCIACNLPMPLLLRLQADEETRREQTLGFFSCSRTRHCAGLRGVRVIWQC